jgi:hypothetical protein
MNIAVKWVPIGTRDVSCSYLDPETAFLTERFRCFPQSLEENAEIRPLIIPQPFFLYHFQFIFTSNRII